MGRIEGKGRTRNLGGRNHQRERKRYLEITEEEIRKYKAKRAQKMALRVAKKLKSESLLSGYSNDSNPFGDSNLGEQFVWQKKIASDVLRGNMHIDAISVKSEKEKQKRRMAEIEKVKKRRKERAMEKARREEESAMLARERARAENQDWEKREKEFEYEQFKIRSDIRLSQGRAKRIDVLSKYLDELDDEVCELDEPYKVLKGLAVKDMEELRQDIVMHLDFDRATPRHVDYWEALLVVCDWELAKARKKDALDRARVRGEEPPADLLAEQRGLHSSIEVDVKNHLKAGTCKELEVLQAHIESQMRSGIAMVVEYWEDVLKYIHVFKARAYLKHLSHPQNPAKTDDDLASQYDDPEPQVEEDFRHGMGDFSPHCPKHRAEGDVRQFGGEYGSFSPELMHDDGHEIAIDPDLDRDELECKRQAVKEANKRRLQEVMASKLARDDKRGLNVSEVMRDIEEGHSILGPGAEVINLDSGVYWWHDKYYPRKPKYFNRVHTGYEWNKYNQTHYDYDNPPPKMVQGYKFDIFYPDLLDNSKAPSYTVQEIEGSDETCLIRFHAGPPYEDIAFKIVNKEWEYSHKKGFKCSFQGGVLRLYFNFKRYRYRR
ncbi:hypothetical protein MKW94_007657 [Papaver nudicaule]|uniref:Splicing factor Cactin n=1 Tax=Papaver nudicaule TaxID=74823 RepID=A0AA41VS91_PAPNU|nr:hypothetical protein [Papaver nudicaule]